MPQGGYTYGISNIPTTTSRKNIVKTTLISLPAVRNLQEARLECMEYDAVITAGPYPDEVQFGHPIHKVVRFGDTTSLHAGGPTYENVCEMLEFGIGVPKLLVHCHAGISRSTATAWGIAIGNGLNPLEAILQLKKSHPKDERMTFGWATRPFAPNRLIVEHLEKYFNLEGELIPIRDHYATSMW